MALTINEYPFDDDVARLSGHRIWELQERCGSYDKKGLEYWILLDKVKSPEPFRPYEVEPAEDTTKDSARNSEHYEYPVVDW